MFVQNFKRLGSLAHVLTQTIKSKSRYARLAIDPLHFFFPRPLHDGLYDLLTMRPACEGMTREYTLQLKPHSAELSFDARIPQSSMRPNTQLSTPSLWTSYPRTANGQNHLNKTVDARGQRRTEANEPKSSASRTACALRRLRF